MRDLVIIGAGWSGLGAAKTYLQVEGSSADVLILDSSATIGGVWAEERLYPELRSNNLLGTYEFIDFPMVGFGVEKGQHIPGTVIHEYLHKYAEHFGLYKRIRFNTKVKTAEYRGDDGWVLTLDGEAGETIECRKLIVATGLASEPILPAYVGSEQFAAPLFHPKDLHQRLDEVLALASSSNGPQRVTVLGGSKYAWDAVYIFASRGIKVDWVIRESGFGPAWMSPTHVSPLKIWAEQLVTTRFCSWLSPCIWGDADGYEGIRGFFHRTWLGRKFVDAFFWIIGNDIIDLTGLRKHEETKKLIPWSGTFWNGAAISIYNYPTDFFEPIRNGTVKIYIKDVDHLSPGTVHLSDGTGLPSSALIISSGWKPKPTIKFLPEGIDATLGLPHKSTKPDALLPKADLEILTKFPKLAAQPDWNKNYKLPPLHDPEFEDLNRPYRLHRLMIPPAIAEKRSVVFLNFTYSIDVPLLVSLQSLWATAYLTGKLQLDHKSPEERAACGQTLREELEYDALLTSRFKRWRYPASRSKLASDFFFDAMPYFDMLLRDLGLNPWRKGGGVKEWFTPYELEDYKDVVKEWTEGPGKQ